MLAERYVSGTGCIKSIENACKYWIMAADRGCIVSQYNMGSSYHRGLGVKKDNHLPSQYYQMAALQGDSNSQYILGSLIAIGEFEQHEFLNWILKEFPTMGMNEVMKNKKCMMKAMKWRMNAAREWVIKAAEQGHKDAIQYLELEEQKLEPGKRSLKKKKMKKKKKKK